MGNEVCKDAALGDSNLIHPQPSTTGVITETSKLSDGRDETQIEKLTEMNDSESIVRKENENIVRSSPLVVQEFSDDKSKEESTLETVNDSKTDFEPDRKDSKDESQNADKAHDAPSLRKLQNKSLVSMDSLDTDIQTPRSRKNSFSDISKEAVQKIKRKTSNLVAPNNHDIVAYCKTLINVSFHGQVLLKAKMELYHLLDEGIMIIFYDTLIFWRHDFCARIV